MSILHFPYDESTFIHQRDPPPYDMDVTLDMKPSLYSADCLLFDQLLRPVAPMSPSHSMPYGLHDSFTPSHYQISALPMELQHGGDIQYPMRVRSIPSNLGWTEADSSFFPESSAYPYPSTSISQPSMFIASSSSGSLAPSSTSSADENAAHPLPPWMMSGSLDPSTGIYQIAPEHPRIRTAQACEKCRGRKAKCSGEHPTCERCRIRGLRCEYAPERKMRGPNKVKRKTGDQSRRIRGRASIASISSEASSTSTTSEISDHSSQKSSRPPHELHLLSSQIIDDMSESRPNTAFSSSSSSSPSSSSIDGSPEIAHAQPFGRSVRPRPSHIDLSGTKLCDQLPMQFVPEDDSFAYDINAFRRASLPSCLLDATPNQGPRHSSVGHVYTPSRGIDVIEATIRPHSNPVHTRQAFAVPPAQELSSGSGSEISASAPLTPLHTFASLPSDGAELMYPLDFHPGSIDLSGIAPHLDTPTGENWDVDVTPRVASDGFDKSLA